MSCYSRLYMYIKLVNVLCIVYYFSLNAPYYQVSALTSVDAAITIASHNTGDSEVVIDATIAEITLQVLVT